MSAENTTNQHKGCPKELQASVACTSAILGNKWMPQLVFALSYGVNRFTELKASAGGVNPRTLSSRLDELEQYGIITKTVHAQSPPKIEYALTDKGKDLVPILERMVEWGRKYNT